MLLKRLSSFGDDYLLCDGVGFTLGALLPAYIAYTLVPRRRRHSSLGDYRAY